MQLNSGTALSTAAARAATFALFPVPAHASATVQVLPMAGIRSVGLRLSDALGRPVRTVEMALPTAGLRHELDLRGLAPGFYLVQATVGSATRTQRLVVE